MSELSHSPEATETPEATEMKNVGEPRSFRPVAPARSSFLTSADAVIAPALLAVTLAICMPIAMRFRVEAQKMDQATLASRERCGKTRMKIQHVEEQRALVSEQRQAATRYLAEIDSRPVTPWSAAVGELCRNRPRGLWAVRLRGNGPRFQAVVQAARPDLVAAYVRKLSKSQRAEFAERPGDAESLQVVGRWRGE